MKEGFGVTFSLLMGPWGIAPNVLIAMNFGDEGFAVAVKGVEEAAVAAVAAVHADDVETDAELTLVADAFQGDGGLGR